MIAEAIIKAAAAGGIAFLLADLTLKAIKISRQIVFSQKETKTEILRCCKYCFECFSYWNSRLLHQGVFVCNNCAEKEVVSKESQEFFLVRQLKINLKNITMSDNKLVKQSWTPRL